MGFHDGWIMEPTLEIDRLDLAARAERSEKALHLDRALLLIFSVFIVSLAVFSAASPLETLAVRLFAVATVLTTMTVYLRWRYALHACAILFLVGPAAGLLTTNVSHSLYSLLWVPTFVAMAHGFWTQATPHAAVHSHGWDRECNQVRRWLNILNGNEGAKQLLEFSGGSFWSGYFTYRILNPGSCWVVARFKRGSSGKLTEFRVLELPALRIEQLPDGKLNIKIADRIFRRIEVPFSMRERLARFGSTSFTSKSI